MAMCVHVLHVYTHARACVCARMDRCELTSDGLICDVVQALVIVRGPHTLVLGCVGIPDLWCVRSGRGPGLEPMYDV